MQAIAFGAVFLSFRLFRIKLAHQPVNTSLWVLSLIAAAMIIWKRLEITQHANPKGTIDQFYTASQKMVQKLLLPGGRYLCINVQPDDAA